MSAISGGDDEVHLPDIRSEEYRSQLHARGKPHGEHILPEDDDMDRRPHIDRDSALAIAMADLRMMQNGQHHEDGTPKEGIRFDWSLNLGHIVAIATILMTGAASYYGIKAELQLDTSERAALTRRVEEIERGRIVNLPKLDEQGQHNKVQDEQIQSLREAIQSLRMTVQEQARNITDLTKLIYDSNAKVLVLENQVIRSQASMPHDR